MPRRVAACLALLVFAMSLIAGLGAGNPFATTIGRALLAMAVTFVIGLILGAMGQRMLEESLQAKEEKLKNLESPSAMEGR